MKEIKNEEASRGNVILLTVIAIVTMIIVVVGATFAYLANSVSPGDSVNINATTNAGSDLLLFNAGEDIDIYADETNFGMEDGNMVREFNASVQLQTSSTTERSYTYRVALTIPQNDFEYTSGTCYKKPAGATVTADSKEACKAANATNIWATADGETYACYGTAEPLYDAFYTNEVACLTNTANIWELTESAELVLDLYRSVDGVAGESTCVSDGVCVDSLRNIVSSATSASACTSADSNNTWLPNIYEEGICYKVDKAVDLTTKLTVDGEPYVLYDTVTITAVDGGTKHSYKGIVTLINYGHNQLVNGNKHFNGMLNFENTSNQVTE